MPFRWNAVDGPVQATGPRTFWSRTAPRSSTRAPVATSPCLVQNWEKVACASTCLQNRRSMKRYICSAVWIPQRPGLLPGYVLKPFFIMTRLKVTTSYMIGFICFDLIVISVLWYRNEEQYNKDMKSVFANTPCGPDHAHTGVSSPWLNLSNSSSVEDNQHRDHWQLIGPTAGNLHRAVALASFRTVTFSELSKPCYSSKTSSCVLKSLWACLPEITQPFISLQPNPPPSCLF